jgi:Flp pilus assembly protein TadB
MDKSNQDDEESLHHGRWNLEVQSVLGALILAMMCMTMFFLFTPKIATVLSVLIVVAVLIRVLYGTRRDRKEMGVVTHQE